VTGAGTTSTPAVSGNAASSSGQGGRSGNGDGTSAANTSAQSSDVQTATASATATAGDYAATAATATAGGGGGTGGAGPTAPTTLRQLPDTVRLTIQTQASSGNSVVRIRLSPPELGDVRVQLQQTSAGLVARVVADHQTSAQTLQQSAAELRRSLEASGVSLLQLDIGASEGESSGASADGEAAGTSARNAAVDAGGEETDGDEETTRTLTLSSGAVVDVLA
jgi:flagellar hook-length control protein FliK